jgi:hypothetical protein
VRVKALLQEYQLPQLPDEQVGELHGLVLALARGAGMDGLPSIEE